MNKRRKIGIKLGIISLLSVIIFVGISLLSSPSKTNDINYGDTTAYKSDQFEIISESAEEENNEFVSISAFYNKGTDGIYTSYNNVKLGNTNGITYYITIKDGLELYAFSRLCNDRTEFLEYNYRVIANINFNEASKYLLEFIPIGWKQNGFSGSFDGQGYEISNLSLLTLIASNSSSYAAIEYISFFASNSGQIKNLGLISTNIIQTIKTDNMVGVAPLVGKNSGTVENCYVVDVRDAASRKGGISASGGYSISGLCYKNEQSGKITNCYTDYSIIVNYGILDYLDFSEVLNTNDGTISGVYFYNHSIDQESTDVSGYSNGRYTNGKIKYSDGLVGVTYTATSRNLYGENLKNYNSLNNTLRLKGWFTEESYTKVSFGIVRPILRGLEQYDSEDGYTFKIKSSQDFAYIFELANKNPLFASNTITYVLMNDIDLSDVPADSYKYNDFFSATFTGIDNYGSCTIELANKTNPRTPTIYGANINNSVVYAGYECYGLFPLLDGNISNINIYVSNEISKFNTGSVSTTKAIGIVSGYAENGKVENVNVYGNINLTTTESTTSYNFGRYIVGGAIGVCGRATIAKKITVAGSINGNIHTVANNLSSAQVGYVEGNCIGGVIGYTVSNVGEIGKCLSAVNITATDYKTGTTYNSLQHIGGVIGAGYTTTASNNSIELVNKNNIIISGSNYGTLYVAGVIGRYLGVTKEVSSMHNQGDISVSFASGITAYVSGVFNADIQTSESIAINKTLNASKGTLIASGLSNSGDISFKCTTTMTTTIANNLNLYCAGVAYVNAKNNFTSYFKGVYNLAYKYDNTQTNLSKWKEDLTKSYTMNIDISLVKEYAPCIVSSATSANGKVIVDTIYNLENLNYTSTQTMFFTNVKYSGLTSGLYITLENASNEGNISVNLNHATNHTTPASLKVYGILEEVNQGCSATSIFNGGNITVYTSVTTSYYNVFASGICYANRNQNVSNYDLYNPLHKNYDKDLNGSLDNVINNGNISTYNSNITTLTATSNVTKGNSNISGICIFNEFVISNTFNLGDMTNNTWILTTNYEVTSAGIAYASIGKYAQIRDSANNGNIIAINMSTVSSTVLSSGIVNRNDVLENKTVYNNNGSQNHLQLLAFVINYGEVYAFNYVENNGTNDNANMRQDSHSISSGVLSIGLCSILNTINYGNIYGTEVASGVFGVVQLYKFYSEISNSNIVTIANSINYGNVKSINKFRTVTGGTVYPVYSDILSLINEQNNDYIGIGYVSPYGQYNGALIGIIYYSESITSTTASTKAQYISIRFLINFNNALNVVGYEFSSPASTTSNLTLVTTRINDSFMGNTVTYAPLSSISDSYGNIGVFSSNFIFRKAIEGKLTNDDISKIGEKETDKYLADFFQFVAFTKINESLLESIGWRTIAFQNAAELFMNDLQSLGTFLTNYKVLNGSGYEQILNEALSNSNWISNCNESVLAEILDEVLGSQDSDSLRNIVKYLFFTSTNKSTITSSMRITVINRLLDSLNTSEENLASLLDSLMYNDLFANIIIESDSDFAYIKEVIENNINTLEYEELVEVAESYLTILSTSDNLNEIFTNNNYAKERMNLVEQLVTGINNTVLENILTNLSGSYSEIAKIIISYDGLKSDATGLKDIYTYLLANNNYGSSVTNINKVITQILNQINSKYTLSQTDATNLNAQLNATSLGSKAYAVRDYNYSSANGATADANDKISSLNYTINSTNYNDLWNLIKNDSSMKSYLNSILSTVIDANTGQQRPGIYAVATEYRNTYQSNNQPTGTVGRTRADAVGTALRNRFIFTPDELVSDVTNTTNKTGKTYYFGPYQSASYSLMTTMPNGKNGGSGSINFVLYDNSTVSTIQTYVPVFISIDKNYLIDLIASKKNPNIYEFIWNNVNTSGSGAGDSNSQWVSTDIIKSKPSDNQAVLLKNSNAGNNYYYDFSTAETATTTSERALGIVSTSGSGTNWSDYETKYLVSYCSAAIHTGIMYQQDQWETYGAFLTSKSGSGTGVITTQFIDYSVDDLINLDGTTTKGKSTGLESLDETQIINVLMQHILSTNDGKMLVTNLTRNALLDTDNDGYASTYHNVAKAFMTAMGSNTTFLSAYMEAIVYYGNAYSLNASTGYTLKEHFFNLFTTKHESSLTTTQKIILLTDNNKSNLLTIINYLYDSDVGYYAFLKDESIKYKYFKDIPIEKISYLYDFIALYKSNGYTDSQIKDIIENSNLAEIEEYLNSYESDISAYVDTINDSDVFTFNNYNGYVDNATYLEETYVSNITTTGNTSTIKFTVPDEASGYATLNIIANVEATSNTYQLTLNGNSATTITRNSIQKYSWTNLEAGEYTLTANRSGIKIYYLELVIGTEGQITDGESAINYNESWERVYDSNINAWVMKAKKDAYVSFTSAASSAYPWIVVKNASGITPVVTGGATYGTTYTFAASTSNSYITIPTGYTLYRSGSSRNGIKFRIKISENDCVYSFSVSGGSGTTTYNNGATTLNNEFTSNVYSGLTFGGTIKNYTDQANTIYNYIVTNGDSSDTTTFPSSSLVIPTNVGSSIKVTGTGGALTLTDPSLVANTSKTLTATSSTVEYTDLIGGNYTLTFGESAIITIEVTGMDVITVPYSISRYSTSYIKDTYYNKYTKYLGGINNYVTSNNELSKYVLKNATNDKYKIFNPSDLSNVESSTTVSTTKDFTIFNAGSNLSVSNIANTTIYGLTFNSILNMSGTGSTSANNIAFNITGNSTVYVYARSNVSDNSTLTLNYGTALTETISPTSSAYKFDITASGNMTCRLYAPSGNIGIYKIVVVQNTKTVDLSNYSMLNTVKNCYSTFGSYESFLELYNKYYNVFYGTTITNLDTKINNDYLEIVKLFYANTYSDINLWKLFTKEQLIGNYDGDNNIDGLIQLIANKDGNVLKSIMNMSSDSSVLMNIIVYLCIEQPNFLSEVFGLVNLSIENMSDSLNLLYVSAYVGSDYIVKQKNTQLSTSVMYQILQSFSSEYRFINSDNTIDNDKFLALLLTIPSFNLATDGYGIYALSSSQGILNGAFIPDNIELSQLDTTYEYTSGMYVLTDSKSNASWRGGVDEDNNAITSDVNSVNYAFYKEMKQLKLSIATNIFDIELISSDGNTVITTPEELINNDTKTISFYIPENADEKDLTYTINTKSGSYVISYNALLDSSKSTSIKASATNPGETTIRVIAEDRTVSNTYTIYLYLSKPVTLELNSIQDANNNILDTPVVSNYFDANKTYTIKTAVAALDSGLKLTLKTTNIPNYTNLINMVAIDGKTVSNGGLFEFNTTPIVTTTSSTYDQINRTWGTGTVTLDMRLLSELSRGEHTITITLANNVIYTVKFTRVDTDGNSITKMVLDGETIAYENGKYTTYIPFGRGYTYEELSTVVNNCPSYLDSITVSPRAVVSINSVEIYKNSVSSANKIDLGASNTIIDGILIYEVIIWVTSENGVVAEYIHYLQELDPFKDAKTDRGTYDIESYDANTYLRAVMNGYTIEGLKLTEDLETYLDSIEIDLDGTIKIIYKREDSNQNELTPKFGFYYSLDYFYSLGTGNIEDYLSVQCSSSSVVEGNVYYAADSKYYGFYANFYADAKPGDYEFNLTYTNSNISWNNNSYTRIMYCPTITITKNYSTDAYLKEIRFLEEGGQLSEKATVASLTEINVNSAEGNNYSELYGNQEGAEFTVNQGQISYNNDKALKASDYYIVGTVSDAVLSTYAPNFTIKSYATIYQYKKFSIDGSRYLYVEFTYVDSGHTNKIVFLVDESFTYVYETGVDDPTIEGSSIAVISNKQFTYGSYTYTISSVAGTTDDSNTGLNMDYIGYPDEGKFWYVDYVIYAEAYQYTKSEDYVNEYHIAVLDLTNNVRFKFTILDESENKLALESVYLTILAYTAFKDISTSTIYLYDEENKYSAKDTSGNDLNDNQKDLSKVISGFATKSGSEYVFIDNAFGIDTYGFQALPYSYFYFYLDLPDGYGCTYEITTEKKANLDNQWGDGSYLAPTSLVTQTIEITIRISESSSADFAWGEKVLAVLLQKADLYIESKEQD